MSTPTYLAIDLETTGLDPTEDIILEIAALVLDEDLYELAAFSAVIEQTAPFTGLMCDDVRQMHTANGLIAEIEQGTARRMMPLVDAIATLTQIASKYPKPPILCGSSVHFDRGFLAVDAPALVALLSHRHLDATTCKLLQPSLAVHGATQPAHRALADIRFSAQQLRDAKAILRSLTPRKAKR
jgi:oligoribonuclease